MMQGMTGTDWANCRRSETQQPEHQKRWQMRPNLRRHPARIAILCAGIQCRD